MILLDLPVSKTIVTIIPLFNASAISQSKTRPRFEAPRKYNNGLDDKPWIVEYI